MPDKIAMAIWGVLQANATLLSGTSLHLLIVRKRSEKNADIKPVGVLGWLTLAGISLLTGVLFRYVGVAYYSFHDLDERSGVLEFLGMLGASAGFTGLMFIMVKIQLGWDLFFKAKLDEIKGNNSNNQERGGYEEYRDPYYNRDSERSSRSRDEVE